MDYYGYNYVQRENSIVNGGTKNLKRCDDMLYHFDNLYSIISNDKSITDEKKKLICSYLANGLILKGSILDNNNLKWYIKELKKRNITDYLISDTFMRKLKKMIIKICPKLYIKSIKKK